jgi:hypothetical protein
MKGILVILIAVALIGCGEKGAPTGPNGFIYNPNDKENPTVIITSPTPSTILSGSFCIEATATDDIGVRYVRFFVGGKEVGMVSRPPYQSCVNPETCDSQNTHDVEILALAYDKTGKSDFYHFLVKSHCTY